MELASVEPSCGSVPAKAADFSALTPQQPARDKKAASDTALAPLGEGTPFHTSTEQPQSESEHLVSSEESSSRGVSLTRLNFLKKLWDIVESDLFESIWWGDNRNSIVINEELFEEEVLERRGRQKIFDSEIMESFTQELHEHGFTMLQAFPKSGPAAGELHFYCMENFRLFPHLLTKFNNRYVPKIPAEFSPGVNLHARSRKRKADRELLWETTSTEGSSPGTAAPGENVHTSKLRMTAPVKRSAEEAT